MNKKRKIYYLLLLFFSTFLISSCGKPTSDNFEFSSSITPSASSKPYFKLTTNSDTATMTMEATASKVTTTNNETTYKNIAPNTDVVYKKIKNGIKEEIILSKLPDTPPVYKFTLDFGNLKPQYFEGQYYFFDSDGYARFTIPRPFMIDAAGAKSEAVSLKINNNLSTVTPDYNWLSDPKRQYPITIDPTIVTPNSPIRELASRRTISAKTYDLGGGKYASTSGLDAIHYQDSNGKWQEKDTTILPSSDPEYNFMNITNNFQTYFSTDGFGQKKAVKFQVKDAWMKFKIMSASGPGQKNEVEDNKFEFKEINKNGDKTMTAAYTLEADRLLEEVILNKFQGFPQIKQEIELHNAVLRPDGKKINAYHTTTNELLWTIPEPVMYELNRPESQNYGLHYEISCQNSNCSNLILTKVIDPEGQAWLSDPSQNYPLVIDISAIRSASSGVADTGYYNEISCWRNGVWNTTTNIQSSNNLYATCTDNYAAPPDTIGSAYSTGLQALGFGFTIPSNSSIDGILTEAEIKGAISYSGYTITLGHRVRLIHPSGSFSTDRGGGLSGSDTYYSSGNSSDLWGLSWSVDDINSGNFGVEYALGYSSICSAGSCSLHKDTSISTPKGYKKISDLFLGDTVFSFNEKLNKIEPKKIIGIIHHPISLDNNRFYYIYYKDKVIKATENHQFYINGKYLRADQLKVGDMLFGINLKQYPIKKIQIVPNVTDEVWDITVADNHNFFAENILTHNTGTLYIDHIRITAYYTEISPAMRFEGVKMEGVKVNAPDLPPTPTPTPIPPTPTEEPSCIPDGGQCDDWGLPCCHGGPCWQGICDPN